MGKNASDEQIPSNIPLAPFHWPLSPAGPLVRATPTTVVKPLPFPGVADGPISAAAHWPSASGECQVAPTVGGPGPADGKT
jgi:hypothetical protein